ncbi:MAG: 7-carboxy-7-deazaguanine synthase [Pelagibacterales bacterium]|nr:7-carboxy-7-deazaguanine synthase [Pelagibacterales bacterium]PPR16431.1 MAG: 7-carboxy-7-deazaguanine synthase [Alphaproteobacteria bacterium MarineAlpha9_Bin3]|tara:strand:- start:351 stop:980 length:630 start_codon:yes stop_codon:yes gene_type:complete
MTYNVKEIFYSIQGEGFHTGRPSIFCRFSGCNLWNGLERDKESAKCSFCDTDFIGTNGQGGSKFVNEEELVSEIISYWPNASEPFVILTGGEPMLQVDKKLIKELKKYKCEIAIETNGTLKVPENIDWICVSPKAGNKLVQIRGDELKLVYPQKNLAPEDFEKYSFKNFSLQPMDGELKVHNTNLALEYCKNNPNWRISLQTHKIIGVR